jgi:hypothetical protein
MEKHEHERESEAPMICARKVETTPVPDLNDAEKKVNVSDGDGAKHDLPYFQAEPRSESADSIGVRLECVQENERVFCYFSRCSNHTL